MKDKLIITGNRHGGEMIAQTTIQRMMFIGILLTYFILGALFAWRVPAWQAPDEPAHYNYVAQVADGTLLPVITEGDWNNAYLENLKARDFPPDLTDDLDTVQYEDHQPPLYYWLQAPVFLLTGGSLLALRLVSVLMGSVTVVMAYLITREMLPLRPHIALGTMALVAFIPQHVHMLASVNNDALAGALIAITLFQTLRYLQGKSRAWHLGILLGLIAITKTTGYFMAGVVLVALLARHVISDDESSALWTRLTQMSLIASLLALPLWIRNMVIYGVPDFLGLGRHDAVVEGQLRTDELISQIGADAYIQRALNDTFNSFWGQFGWMEARLGDALPPVMWLILALVLIATLGLFMQATTLDRPSSDNPDALPSPPVNNAMWSVLGLTMTLALAQFVYYNTEFVQFQGRYIFAGLVPFAMFMVYGVDAWRQALFGEAAWAKALVIASMLWFAPLDVYLIWRVIPGAVSRLVN